MQLRGSTTTTAASYRQGIIEEIDRLCDSDDVSYPRADKTSRVNNSLEKVIAWIMTADGTWEFDDTNFTDHPRGTGTLVEGQEDYAFASEYLDIEAIEILNTASPAQYLRIKPLSHQDLGGLSPEEYFGLTTAGNARIGFPEYYDKQGDTIRLYPAPTSTNVTLTAGIRVWFKRTASLFTVTTGTGEDTKVPGFVSPFHPVLAYMAAIPYCLIHYPERVPRYAAIVGETDPPTGIKRDIIRFYGHREADKRKVITMKSIKHR